MQFDDGSLQQSERAERYGVHRWQCVYANGYLRDGHMHGRESGRMHAGKSMPKCGYVRSRHRNVFEYAEAGRERV